MLVYRQLGSTAKKGTNKRKTDTANSKTIKPVYRIRIS